MNDIGELALLVLLGGGAIVFLRFVKGGVSKALQYFLGFILIVFVLYLVFAR